MITEKARQELYGDMMQEEIDLCYHHNGNYKDWICQYTGCGQLLFEYTGKDMYKSPIIARRGLQVKNWIPECWKECKQKIDELE